MIKPIAAIFVIAGFVAAAISADFSAARADELNDLRTNKSAIQSRIDQLARPAEPRAGDRSGASPPAIAPNGVGSFPRSFLIPGTNTSMRVGGVVDETMGYHAH
jgi:hypothetical protein